MLKYVLCKSTFFFFYLSKGKTHYTVDSGFLTFSNHGCNGTVNYGYVENNLTEMNVDLDEVPEEFDAKTVAYSPLIERHIRQIMSFGDYTLHDIKAGEEILTNYLEFSANPESWKEDILSLQAQCSGKAVGVIATYESEE